MQENTSLSKPYQYQALCQGPYCYDDPICPDLFALAPLTSNSWPVWSKVVIAALILGILVLTLAMKVSGVCVCTCGVGRHMFVHVYVPIDYYVGV